MSWLNKFLGVSVATVAVAGAATQVHKLNNPPPPPVTATVYNGLLYAEMGTIANMLSRRGVIVDTLWHDQEETDTRCPNYILGHSMGANATISQAIKCTVRYHKPPKAIILIDPGRCAEGNFPCDVPETLKNVTCINFYNPAHAIGGQEVSGFCKNVVVTGYDHLYMPVAPTVLKYIQATVK